VGGIRTTSAVLLAVIAAGADMVVGWAVAKESVTFLVGEIGILDYA